MRQIEKEIRELERRLEVVGHECRAAEIGRETSEIEAAWSKRDALQAELKARKAERDNPPEQQRADAHEKRRFADEHIRRRYAFEGGIRGAIARRSHDL